LPCTKKAKMINTNKPMADEAYPAFAPYRNNKVPDSGTTRNISDMMVRALVELSTGAKAKSGGVSVTQIKNYIKQEFQKDMSKPTFRARFSQALAQGLETGQWVKTSLGGGASGGLGLPAEYSSLILPKQISHLYRTGK
jgi:hypothetical protein